MPCATLIRESDRKERAVQKEMIFQSQKMTREKELPQAPNRFRSRRADRVLFPILLAIYTGVMLYLFWMQCYQVPDFVSDMPDYVNYVAGIRGNYEFPYPVMFVLARILAVLTGPAAAVALVTTFLNSLGVIVTKVYLERILRAWNHSLNVELTATASVFILFLLGNLYSPKNTAFFGFDYAYRCMGIYTPNPIWNATYLAVRPFSVICFFEACRMLLLIGEKGGSAGKPFWKTFPWKESIPFAAGLLLATLTKPSYTLVVMPALAILMLALLLRSRGRSFGWLFAFGLTMLPTVAVLLYQFGGVFRGTNVMGEETGIGFAFGKVWSNYSTNIPLSILMGMALPVGVLVLNGREFFRHMGRKEGQKVSPADGIWACYGFAWLNYLVAAVMFLCLYEKGFRMLHANFSWGYMHGMFFVFLMTLFLVIKNTAEWFKSWKILFAAAEWAVLAYHLVCGVNFLVYALQGKELAGF